MSLVLRQACEPLFTKAGLPEIHADISQESKFLNLCNPCGKIFASIGGIRFSRTQPTNTEIAYAVKLLEKYLAEHGPLFRDIVKTRDELNAYPNPHDQLIGGPYDIWLNDPGESYRVYGGTHYEKKDHKVKPATGGFTQNFIGVPDVKLRVQINGDGKITDLNWDIKKAVDPGKLEKLPINRLALKATKEAIKKYQKFVTLRNKMQHLNAELNKCVCSI